MRKYASFAILSAQMLPKGSPTPVQRVFKVAHRADFEYDPKPGFLYVRSRAISSRCNDNFDEFPAEEIEAGYLSFVGKPVFVNHVNDNHRRARGVIIAAALHKDANPDGSPDTWCEVLMEIDAVRFPMLARAILSDPPQIDRTSMGVDVAYSVCTFCGNKAATPLEYCAHIPRLKGKRIERTTASGDKQQVLVAERCYGLSFFENSLLVEQPADPTAFFLGVDDRGLQTTASTKRIATAQKAYLTATVKYGTPPGGHFSNSRYWSISWNTSPDPADFGGPIDMPMDRDEWDPVAATVTVGAAGLTDVSEWIFMPSFGGYRATAQWDRSKTSAKDPDYAQGGEYARYEQVVPTATEIQEHVKRHGRQPATYRYRCRECDKRIWGSGLGIGAHNRWHSRNPATGPSYKDLGREIDKESSMRSPHLAYGETIAPAKVDTLRDSTCPVCGEESAYNGAECAVCGFTKPPDMFMDPDTSIAGEQDLRQDQQDAADSAPTGYVPPSGPAQDQNPGATGYIPPTGGAGGSPSGSYVPPKVGVLVGVR